MYVLSKDTKEKEAMMAKPPFGPGFTEEDITRAETMDILATDINDPGSDYVMFILRDKKGNTINSKKIKGY